MKRALFTLLLAACSAKSGGTSVDAPTQQQTDAPAGTIDAPAQTVDAPAEIDAPQMTVDAPNGTQTITISGTTTERGLSGTTNVQGVAIDAFRVTDENTSIAQATSSAQGAYAIMIPTGGQPLDGYMRATKASYMDIFLYPPGPFTDSASGIEINMITPQTFGFLGQLAGVQQQAGKGFIALAVVDAAGNPVQGATVSTNPAGTVRYMGANGTPSSTATSTSAEGVAFVFNVAAGPVTVSAAKTGTTFVSHDIKARADKFTQTLVTP